MLSATYFDAKWKEDADNISVSKKDFINRDGSVSKVEMMTFPEVSVNTNTSYERFTIYYSNGGFAYEIILPSEGQNLDACLTEAVSAEISQTGANTACIVKLTFPKYSMQYSSDTFLDLMKKCGLERVGSSEALFDKIVSHPTAMERILHATNIEVSERGSKAAAVSDIEFSITSNGEPPVPPLEYTIDRPFSFIIRETSTGTVLFMGRVNNL